MMGASYYLGALLIWGMLRSGSGIAAATNSAPLTSNSPQPSLVG